MITYNSLDSYDENIQLLLYNLNSENNIIEYNSLKSISQIALNKNHRDFNNLRILLPIFYQRLNKKNKKIKFISYYTLANSIYLALFLVGNAGKYLLVNGCIRDKNIQNRLSILSGLFLLGPKYTRLIILQLKDYNIEIKTKSAKLLLKWGVEKCLNNVEENERDGLCHVIRSILSNTLLDLKLSDFLKSLLQKLSQ